MDRTGEGHVPVQVYAARVRSVDRFDYGRCRELIDRGTGDQRLVLLRRSACCAWPVRPFEVAQTCHPGSEVHQDEDGSWTVHFRPPLACGLERPDLADDRYSGCRVDDRRQGRSVAPCRPPSRRRSTASGTRRRRSGCPGEATVLGSSSAAWTAPSPAARADLRGDRPLPRAGYAAFDGAVPEHPGACGSGLHLCPHDSAAASPRRSLRAGRVRGHLGPARRAGLGPGDPADVAGHSQEVGSTRQCGGASEHRRHGGRDPRRPGGEKFPAVVVEVAVDGGERRRSRGAVVQVLEPAVVAELEATRTWGAESRGGTREADIGTGRCSFRR